jgi:SHS2 domain-containing protein
MAYKLLPHEADIGVQGIGSTVEEAFEEGAKAMFDVMVEIKKVELKNTVDVECEAYDIEALFVEWLNNLLAKRDIDDMVFSKFEVKIEKKDNRYHLKGKAHGEKLDQEKHKIKTEVKAATYSGLKHEEKEGKHYMQCVLDI